SLASLYQGAADGRAGAQSRLPSRLQQVDGGQGLAAQRLARALHRERVGAPEPARHGRGSFRTRRQGAGRGMSRLLAIIILMLSAGAALAQTPAYQEVPSFAETIAKGDLPPIDQRLPEHPAVAQFQWPGQAPGHYGGELDILMSSAQATRYP